MLEQVRNTVLFFWLLDETKTAMGMRLLRTWIDRPLVNQAAIMERQNIIQVFLGQFLRA